MFFKLQSTHICETDSYTSNNNHTIFVQTGPDSILISNIVLKGKTKWRKIISTLPQYACHYNIY